MMPMPTPLNDFQCVVVFPIFCREFLQNLKVKWISSAITLQNLHLHFFFLSSSSLLQMIV